MAGHAAQLNEWQFAVDAARGMTQRQLQERHDIGRDTVRRIVRGESRPHVARIVCELRSQPDAHVRLRVAAMQAKAIEVLERALGCVPSSTPAGGKTGGENADEPADPEVSRVSLAAAKELLTRTLGRNWGPATPKASRPTGTGSRLDILALSPETRRRVLAELRAAGK